jgi:hypothetical protein
MICKGWIKVGLLRSFEKTFHIEAMKENITTPLFPTIGDPKTTNIIEPEFTSEEGTSDPNDSMEDTMEQSLNRVARLCRGSKNSAASIAEL